MNKDEISKYAYIEELPQESMNSAERCLWYALRDVYRRFKSGNMDKATGDFEKSKALRQFDIDSGKLNMAERIIERDASMWQEIELSANMYHMHRTLENADAFVSAVYGVKLKNNNKENREMIEA